MVIIYGKFALQHEDWLLFILLSIQYP